MARERADPVAALEAAASTLHRLAVLLAAGVAPHRAWGHLAATDPVASEVNEHLGGGGTVTEALLARRASVQDASPESTVWRAIAAAWLVATDSGAPLASSLRSFAGALRGLAQSRRETRVALAGPAATVRVVLVLPVVGLVLGLALGFDTFGVLFGSVPGFACLTAATVLLLLARRWNRRLLRGATPTDAAPGLRLDLVAIAVSGGAAIDVALDRVESALTHCGIDARDSDTVVEVLELSRTAGVPAGELLRAEADEVRRRERAHAQQAAARLGVTLMIPLGVCILPAFMLVGVVPLVVAVISSTVTGA